MVRNEEELGAAVTGVLRNYPEVRSACVFGSFARGEQNDSSDVDLLVSIDGRQSYRQNFRLRHDLESALGRSVDIVTTLRGASPYFISELRRDSVCIYESRGPESHRQRRPA